MNLENDTFYTLEVIARISGVDAETILHYQKQGFIRPLAESGEQFDDDALRRVRRIEHLRETCGVNDAGLRLILNLLDELERLKQ